MQAAGIGAGVGGAITANRIVGILQSHILNIPVSDVINQFNSDVIQYTQASAGLAIGLGILSLLVAVSIVLRVGKFKLDTAGQIILIVVSL